MPMTTTTPDQAATERLAAIIAADSVHREMAEVVVRQQGDAMLNLRVKNLRVDELARVLVGRGFTWSEIQRICR